MPALSVLCFTSCSPFHVKTDYAQTANFSTYKTYKLRIDDLKLNDIDKDRVLNELSRQLQTKGLSVADNPDLIVNVKASHKNVKEIYSRVPYTVYGGFGRYGWNMGVGRTWGTSSAYNSGTLVIDLIDAHTNKLVWQGIGEGLMVDSPKLKQKEVPQMIAEIMANYPPNAVK